MTDAHNSVLFETVAFGSIKSANRVLMAPLTRNRANPDGTPGDLAAEYYTQRAGAGVIITEATQISPFGKGYLNTPGIHSPEQVAKCADSYTGQFLSRVLPAPEVKIQRKAIA